MQMATKLRQQLAEAGLQLVREFIFNSEENVTQAMLNLKVSEYYITSKKFWR